MDTQILRLIKYLHALQQSGEACVFIRYSGHVQHFDVEIAESREDYNTKLYTKQIDFVPPPYKPDQYRSYLKTRKWKPYVDGVIADIETALAKREEIVNAAKAKKEAAERKELARLKAKYDLPDDGAIGQALAKKLEADA